jgi:hypothetical protein
VALIEDGTPCGECGAITKRRSGLCRRCDPARAAARERTAAATERPSGREQTQELLAQIEAGVEGLVTGDDWVNWLNTQARFRDYSFSNTMLILIQKPDATRVAGYRTWQALGRQVNAGERGLTILAPMIRKVEDEETGTSEKRLVGFRGVKVFDISQTSGDDLPDIAPALSGDAPEQMIEQLTTHAESLGAEVEMADPSTDSLLRSGANGYARRGDGSTRYKIVVSSALDPAQRAKTLAHEIGHVQLGHLDPDENQSGAPSSTANHTLRADRELEAESFAFLVSNRWGLDTSGYSFGYVAHWSGGDPKRVRAAAERVASAAKQLGPTLAHAPADGERS